MEVVLFRDGVDRQEYAILKIEVRYDINHPIDLFARDNLTSKYDGQVNIGIRRCLVSRTGAVDDDALEPVIIEGSYPLHELPDTLLDLLLVVRRGGVLEAGLNIFSRQRRVFMQEPLNGVSVGKHVHDLIDRDPRALHAGLTMTDARVNRDSVIHGAYSIIVRVSTTLCCNNTSIVPDSAVPFQTLGSAYRYHFSTAPVSALVAIEAYLARQPVLIRGSGGFHVFLRWASSFSESLTFILLFGMSISMMIAVFQQADGSADGRFGADMADAGAARAAAETAVGDQGDRFAESRAHDVAGGAEHLLHAGAALGAFVADDDDVAGLDLAGQDAFAGVFLALEDDGRAGVREHRLGDAGAS